MQHQINNRQYALDMTWISYPSSDSKSTRAEQFSIFDAKAFCEYETDDSVNVLGVSEHKQEIGVVSAAYHLAQCENNCVLVEPIDDQRYWVSIILYGVIATNYGDKIVSLEQVMDLLKEYFATRSDQEREQFSFYSPDENFLSSLSDEESQLFQAKNFAQLTSSVNYDDLLGNTKVGGTGSAIQKKVVVYSVLTIGAVLFMAHSQGFFDQEEPVVVSEPVPAPVVVEPEEELEEEPTQEEKLLSELSTVLTQFSPGSRYSAFMSVNNTLYRSHGLWNLERIDMTSRFVEVSYQRTSRFTRLKDLTDLYGYPSSMDSNGQKAVFKLPLVHSNTNVVTLDSVDDLVEAEDRFDLINIIERSIPASWAITQGGPSQDGIVLKSLAVGWTAENPSPVSEYKFSVDFNSEWELQQFINSLMQTNTVALEFIQMDELSNLYTVKGVIYDAV